MNPVLQQMFSGVGSASANRGGTYFYDGKYTAILANLISKTDNGATVILETMIKTAEATEPGVSPNQPGTIASSVIKFGDTKESQGMARAKLKGIGCAILGVTEAEFDAQQTAENQAAAAGNRVARDLMAESLAYACRDDAPFRGTLLAVSTFRKPTKKQKAQNPVPPRSDWNCYPQFDAIPNQTESEIAANRAIVDGTASLPTVAATAPAPAPVAPPPAPVPMPAPVAAPAPVAPPPAPVAPSAPAPTGGILGRLGLA